MNDAASRNEPILHWIRDQDDIVARLLRAVRSQRVANAYLFHGPRGTGKTRTALGLAQALNCAASSPPCGGCPPCRKVASLTHPDVRLVFPATKEEDADADGIAKRLEEYGKARYHPLGYSRNASIGIEKIRALKLEAAMSHAEGRHRVYVLSDAQRMTEDSAQSALKLLEEPPRGTHIVLTVEEPSALLPTIVSRCQQVRFRPLRRETIEEILVDQAGVDGREARLVAGLANGSLGRALDMTEEESIVKARDEALALFRVGPDPRTIQEKVKQWAKGLDPNRSRRSVELLLIWCRDLLAVKYGLPEATLANPDRRSDLESEAARMSLAQLRVRIDALEEWIESLERNVNPPLALHNLLLRIAGAPTGADRATR